MDGINIIVGLSNSFAGILMILLAIPLIRRSVRMNRSYGFRFKNAFRDEQNWLAINEYGGKWLAGLGTLLLVAGMASFFLPIPDSFSVYLAFSPLLVVVPFLSTYMHARRLTAS